MPLIIQDGAFKIISKSDTNIRKIVRIHHRRIHQTGQYEITYDKKTNRFWCDLCTVYIKPKNLMKHRRL